ncbi:WHG domain-containing protein [uncultured Paracoccus sp.]|uniref:WHG domain-containing protein n=1 Tax=uncultured Paracoccus sp. TaxID=189685 RepID=UPI00261FD83D|nr:WHG domain-containing protein [uncultured Paracoccus sp.]
MEAAPDMRPYDRLLKSAAEQMAAASPQPDLARAAEDAEVPLEQAQAWFADACALSAAVIEQQMVLLTDHLVRRASAAPQDDVVAQLRELSHAYVEWFFDNPVGGRLLVTPPAMATVSEHKVSRFSTAIYDLARAMMERARDTGMIRADIDIAEVMLTMRTLTLGIVVQDMDHTRLWGNPGDPRAALTRMMNSYFDMAMSKA